MNISRRFREREKRITEAERDIIQATARLRGLRSGTVKVVAPENKKTAIERWTARLKEREADLKTLRAKLIPTSVPIDARDMSVGSVGQVDYAKLVQAWSDNDALALVGIMVYESDRIGPYDLPQPGGGRHIEKLVWLKGLDFKGKVDDEQISLDKYVFKITGTKRYETEDGGTKTVFVIEPYKPPE